MNIRINTINFDADKKLLNFVDNKIKKLDNYFEGITGAEIFLTFNKSKRKQVENKEAKLKIEIPGNELFAEKKAKSFEEAIDNVIDALEKQIKKYRKKRMV